LDQLETGIKEGATLVLDKRIGIRRQAGEALEGRRKGARAEGGDLKIVRNKFGGGVHGARVNRAWEKANTKG
jgi:hypothetical protein